MKIDDHVLHAWLGNEILNSYRAGNTPVADVREHAARFRAEGNVDLADAMLLALDDS